MENVSSEIPPGWDYNPSTWGQRLPLVAVAVVGLGISLYLGLYQLRIIPSVWDPFFGSASSQKVLNSPLSRLLPIPDALLGAIAYGVDAITGVFGRTGRWKTLPWLVVLFGVAVGPMGTVSVLLVIAQPILENAWCTLCLISAAISIAMIGPAMDEVLASLQFLQRVKRSGQSVWKAFWGNKAIISTVR
ncbi:vitamin K epoxide reductase family protein [Fibrisoma limi]|nr:vitamin K epoxide reductase family protein [Fibrisoma limi]